MKLDDRPVIDQLLNPTPLNVLYDVQDDLMTWLDNTYENRSPAHHEGAWEMLREFVAAIEARL